ncbi:MAG: nucleotidyltransferase family protein [Faecalibacterium sp.]|nr:nucleotidyltransferase family protein [Faecalibacterium sp.]
MQERGAADLQIVGIIAEYDPFHNGHAWQIEAAQRQGAARVIVALSCGATQRGGLPLIPEAVRARAALLAGADLVLALPAPCACSGAEHFAASGVAVLAAAGCDTLVCGAETLTAAQAMAAAKILLSPAYEKALRAALGEARSFAAAREQAFLAAGGAEILAPAGAAAPSLRSPNDNLCIEYAKAILRQNTGMALCTLPRVGVGHGEAQAAQIGGKAYASASRLRALWHEKGAHAVAAYVPGPAFALYAQAEKQGLALDVHAADLALLSRLRAKAAGAAPFSEVRGVSEGLHHALEKAVRTAVTAEQLCDSLTTVRYPRARMRRLVLDAALGYTAALDMLPPYLHVLAARRAALPLLADARLPADTSLARLEKKSPACAAFAEAQSRAADFGALCRRSPGPMGLAYSTPCELL